jgi:NADPH-dependent 2,4-dienoyl-CoA reductase/sulfur reductase-like enzyme
VEADLVVIGLGVRPNVDLARAAGIGAGEAGGMDLAYAPPFSPVWDPVLTAAGKAASKI